MEAAQPAWKVPPRVRANAVLDHPCSGAIEAGVAASPSLTGSTPCRKPRKVPERFQTVKLGSTLGEPDLLFAQLFSAFDGCVDVVRLSAMLASELLNCGPP